MPLETISCSKSGPAKLPALPGRLGSAFLYALPCFFVFLLITLIIPPHSTNYGYFAALRDKHRRLEHVTSPKMIFVGGSNLAFGLDSNLIEKTFQMPVVNMGLCAPFGLRYMLQEIKTQIKPGDLIVIVPEYGILQNLVDGSSDLIHAVEVYPQSALFIAQSCASSDDYSKNLANLAFGLPATKWFAFSAILAKMWKTQNFDLNLLNNWEISDPIGPAVRYYFEKHGHFFGHFARPNRPYQPNWEIVKSMSPEAADLLNKFSEFVHQQGANVVLIPAPIPREYLTANMCAAQVVANWPDKHLSIPVLGRPRRYALPASYFYEVPYHLNLAGREQRSALIIEDLKTFLANNRSIKI